MREAIGWRLQQRLIPLRTSMLAVPVVRQIYRALYRALEIWVDEGFLKIFSRAGHKVSLALAGAQFPRRGSAIGGLRESRTSTQQWMVLHGVPPSRDDDAGRDRSSSASDR